LPQEEALDVQAHLNELKRDLEDLDFKLMSVRREGYVCFKLIGDLIKAEYTSAQVAIDLIETELDHRHPTE
jgi:hypothetical protein